MDKEHVQMRKLVKKESYWVKLIYLLPFCSTREFRFKGKQNIRFLYLCGIDLYLNLKKYFMFNPKWSIFVQKLIGCYTLSTKYDLFKRKRKRKRYVVVVRKTKNNFFFTLKTLRKGEVICWCNAGFCKITTKKMKRARDTFKIISRKFSFLCRRKKIKSIFGFNIYYIPNFPLNALLGIIRYNFWKRRIKTGPNIWIYMKNAHNGIRLKKRRRL